jgi:general secretion pathway protein F
MKFQYQALQPDGRSVSGQIEAPSIRGAHRDLVRRGVHPMAISAAARTQPGQGLSLFRTKPKARRRDHLYVLKEMHALFAGGVPIAEAVSALAEGAENPALADSYAELNARLRRGEKFSAAFAQCFPAFPVYIQRVIEAGELSGRLGAALADASAQMEHEAKVGAELRNALVYPTFLVGFGTLAILFIFIVVVPRFATMFRGKYDQIPWLSYAVIAGGMWFHEHLLLTATIATLLAVVVVYAALQPQWRLRGRELIARIPLVRAWMVEAETARWAGVLARLLENRVPLMQSLELARTSLRSRDIQSQLLQVERNVRTGGALAKALEEHRFLPSTALSLVRVGERSGNLAEMMRSVASIYEEIVRNRIRTVLSLIEPVAIVLIGGAIAMVAVAIFMAITSINNVPGL